MPLNTHILNDTVEIQRITPSSVDERGNVSNEWSTSNSSAECRIVSAGSTEDREGKNTTIETLSIYFGESVDVKANDRIKNGSKYYEIVGVNTLRDVKGENCYTVISCLYRE